MPRPLGTYGSRRCPGRRRGSPKQTDRGLCAPAHWIGSGDHRSLGVGGCSHQPQHAIGPFWGVLRFGLVAAASPPQALAATRPGFLQRTRRPNGGGGINHHPRGQRQHRYRQVPRLVVASPCGRARANVRDRFHLEHCLRRRYCLGGSQLTIRPAQSPQARPSAGLFCAPPGARGLGGVRRKAQQADRLQLKSKAALHQE